MDTLRVIQNRYLVDLINNLDSNRESPLIRYIDNESDSDRNRKKENNSKDPRLERPNYRQN